MPGEVEARSPVYGQDWRCPVLETDKDGGQSLTRLGGIALLGLSFLGLLGSSMNPELLDSVHLSSSLHLSTRCHHLQQHQRGSQRRPDLICASTVLHPAPLDSPPLWFLRRLHSDRCCFYCCLDGGL